MIKRGGTVFTVLAGAFLLAGCGDAVENKATDNAFLRIPGAKIDDVPVKDNAFLPLAAGSRWTMILRRGQQIGSEETVALGTRTQQGVTGEAIEFRTGGIPVRQEWYRENKEGLWFVAAGTDKARMTMVPAIPMVTFPLKEGQTLTWKGNLKLQGAMSAGTAVSRVSGKETIETEAGKFGAYRVDTMINAVMNGQAISIPARRWIAPGVGVVKMKQLQGKDIVWKELKSYRIAGAAAGAIK